MVMRSTVRITAMSGPVPRFPLYKSKAECIWFLLIVFSYLFGRAGDWLRWLLCEA